VLREILQLGLGDEREVLGHGQSPERGP
jgi:hypothetical protein